MHPGWIDPDESPRRDGCENHGSIGQGNPGLVDNGQPQGPDARQVKRPPAATGRGRRHDLQNPPLRGKLITRKEQVQPGAAIRQSGRVPGYRFIAAAPAHAIGKPGRWQVDIQLPRVAPAANAKQLTFQLRRCRPDEEPAAYLASRLRLGLTENQIRDGLGRSGLEDQQIRVAQLDALGRHAPAGSFRAVLNDVQGVDNHRRGASRPDRIERTNGRHAPATFERYPGVSLEVQGRRQPADSREADPHTSGPTCMLRLVFLDLGARHPDEFQSRAQLHRESHQATPTGLDSPVRGPVRRPSAEVLGRAELDAGRSAHPDQRFFTGGQRPEAVQQPQIASLGTAVEPPRLEAVMGRGQRPFSKPLGADRQPARRELES